MNTIDFAVAAQTRSTQAGFSFDPATIIAAITAVITLLKNCGKTPAQAASRVNNPSLLDKLVLRRELKKAGVKPKDIDSSVAALVDEAKNLKTADLKIMYAEVGS